VNQTRTPYNKNWQNYVILASPIHLRLKALYKCSTNFLTYLPVQMWSLAGALAAHSNDTNLISNTTKFDYVSSTDVPICRRSTRFRAWSTSSPLIFLQNTRCSTHTYHSRRQKFCCRRTARVEQFTDYYKTDHQLWAV